MGDPTSDQLAAIETIGHLADFVALPGATAALTSAKASLFNALGWTENMRTAVLGVEFASPATTQRIKEVEQHLVEPLQL